MSCESFKEGITELVADSVSKKSIGFIYYKPKTKWHHKIPILSNFFYYTQFGTIYPKNTSNFKEGDRVNLIVSLEKVNE